MFRHAGLSLLFRAAQSGPNPIDACNVCCLSRPLPWHLDLQLHRSITLACMEGASTARILYLSGPLSLCTSSSGSS